MSGAKIPADRAGDLYVASRLASANRPWRPSTIAAALAALGGAAGAVLAPGIPSWIRAVALAGALVTWRLGALSEEGRW